MEGRSFVDPAARGCVAGATEALRKGASRYWLGLPKIPTRELVALSQVCALWARPLGQAKGRMTASAIRGWDDFVYGQEAKSQSGAGPGWNRLIELAPGHPSLVPFKVRQFQAYWSLTRLIHASVAMLSLSGCGSSTRHGGTSQCAVRSGC